MKTWIYQDFVNPNVVTESYILCQYCLEQMTITGGWLVCRHCQGRLFYDYEGMFITPRKHIHVAVCYPGQMYTERGFRAKIKKLYKLHNKQKQKREMRGK